MRLVSLSTFLCVAISSAGCSRSPSADSRIIGLWEGTEAPKPQDPRDKFEEVTISADFKDSGEFILSLAGEPMFKGSWKALKIDGNTFTIRTDGRDITRSGSVAEINGKKTEKWEVKEGPLVTREYVVTLEEPNRLRFKSNEPEPWEIALSRRP